MKAHDVFYQNDGDVTKNYYSELSKRKPLGEIAVALFRAQKRSKRAKDYRRGKWKRAAYDVKNWSIGVRSATRLSSGREASSTDRASRAG